jgi:DNA-binding NtrC family response regulator
MQKQHRDETAKKTETILLIDYEMTLTKVLEMLLKKEGYNVITYNNTEIAIEYFLTHSENIDLIILDYNLAKMNGDDADITLQSINPKVKMILCSGYELKEKNLKSENAVQYFLKKPFSTDELLKCVQKTLTAPESQTKSVEGGNKEEIGGHEDR